MALTGNYGIGMMDEVGATVSSTRARLLYSATAVGATAAIDSGDLNCAGVSEVSVVIVNGNTTVTRTPTFTFKDEAANTLDTFSATAVPAATKARYAFGMSATTTGITSGYAITPSPIMRITTDAPASGTGTSSIAIWGR